MSNINLINIYPQLLEINNEINLLRIVDKKVKESLVFYCSKNENTYRVYMLNTMTGQEVNIKKYSEKSNLKNLVEKFKLVEIDINKLKTLEEVENYILKIIYMQ